MPRFSSILSRIISLHVLVLAMAAVAIPLASYLLLNATANSYENQTLRAHAATIARYLSPGANGELTLRLPSDLQTYYARGFDGFAYSIVDADGRPLFSSLSGGAAILSGRPAGNSSVYFQHRKGRAVYYGAELPQRIAGRAVWVQIAQDLEHPDVILDDVVAGFLRQIGWFTIPIILLVIAIDVLVVRHALDPVRRASKQAQTIDPLRLDLRVSTHRIPREIQPLVEAFNHALDRLARDFRVQREFTANAAHELRTPLAVLRARVDAVENAETARRLRHDIDVMSRIVGQLLEIAELEGAPISSEEVLDLRSACARAAEHVAPLAASAGQDIRLSGTKQPVLVKGDAEMVFRAVRNVIENATKYAPPSSGIEICVTDDGVVRVMDEGPGIPEAEHALVFHRFWRRSRTRSDGAGLGLSIVSGIVEAHGGSVAVRNRDKQGCEFSLRFPLAHLM